MPPLLLLSSTFKFLVLYTLYNVTTKSVLFVSVTMGRVTRISPTRHGVIRIGGQQVYGVVPNVPYKIEAVSPGDETGKVSPDVKEYFGGGPPYQYRLLSGDMVPTVVSAR